tara:strand:+ start:6937 stop:7869 length:933 start_codon:yes stop_codon:yes gene_type:complete
MATSGTTAFNMDFTEIAEEAWERAGRELRSGYDLRTARRSMNLMTIEWQNRGINMWTIDQGFVDLAQGQSTYALPDDTIDLMEHQIRTGAGSTSLQSDLTISRISVSTYASIPNKLTQGRPVQVFIHRNSGQTYPVGITLAATVTITATTITLSGVSNLPPAGFVKIEDEIINYSSIDGNILQNCFRGQQGTTAVAHTVVAGAQAIPVYWEQVPAATVWPIPDGTQSYQLVYWRMRRIEDAGGGVQTADMNFRFFPCLVAGLAYYIAMKDPQLVDRVGMLKQIYEEQFDLAAQEDREKTSARFVPKIGRI